jgi:holo-[acyl-carrier protein] synthase
MNLLGLGFDLVDLAKLDKSLLSEAYRRRVFTVAEIEIAQARPQSLEAYAGKFAVKEAVMKCLGAGIQQGLWFRQIEILNATTGAPLLILHNNAKSLADERGILSWQISISHTAHTAGAVVLALGN